MSSAPLILSADAKEVLSILLVAWTLAVVAWALWVSAPARRKPAQPHEPPPMPMPQARAKRPRLVVLRGPDQ